MLGSIAVTRGTGNGTRYGGLTKNFQNETETDPTALLGIGLLEGSGGLHAGTTKVPGVPLKQRPVLIARDHRRTLKTGNGEIPPRMVGPCIKSRILSEVLVIPF